MQNPALARWHAHLHGLVKSIHEISGLGFQVSGFPPQADQGRETQKLKPET
jgi:hypothetical protein